ncbi:hypothetical protein D3C76_1825650 [compost metagenome]
MPPTRALLAASTMPVPLLFSDSVTAPAPLRLSITTLKVRPSIRVTLAKVPAAVPPKVMLKSLMSTPLTSSSKVTS